MGPSEQSFFDGVGAVVAVVAHPDDESFGLGALLDHLTARGAEAAVLCFTRGEASTLGTATGDLAEIRAAELAAASAVLGVTRTELLGYPDGRLDRTPLRDLVGQVRRLAFAVRPSHLLAFDVGGITGHPDHVHATRAALLAGRELGLPVLGWTVPDHVAKTLNTEFGTAFVGRPELQLGQALAVDRTRQRRAIACHRSQATANPVLYRRLELQGGTEHVRLLRGAATDLARVGKGREDGT
ncbi:PIG-L deacetylase family protein [Actinomadura formosensis]|uniref:PIG-L deacetylase family protein n=1 Tax=Actinomadura formosensis TaxID=60706 RepID=UPI003D8B16D3